MSQCDICDAIWARLTNPSVKQKVELGPLDEAAETSCSRHGPLARVFRDYRKGRRSMHPHPVTDAGFTEGNKRDSVMLTESLSKLGLCWHLLLVNRPEVPDHPGKGQILDPDWIDLEKIKHWKQTCLRSHATKCENPMRIQVTRPAWLVDCEKKCIVSGSGGEPYLALSYRWGDSSGYRLTEGSLKQVTAPGALSMPEMVEEVPLMIQNAIELVPLLGERYLWVDALCVLQGSHANTAEQLKLMAAIYANAMVTIVAADGEASEGLLGIPGVSPSREFKQTVIPFGEEKIIKRNTGIFSMDTGTEYYDRAWPYQEFRMSPRKLLFNRKEVHWECQCAVYHEELVRDFEVDKYIDSRLKVILSGLPDMNALSHALTKYNEKKLTYDEDAAPGIAGLLAVLSRSFKGGFLYGCPEMLFDRAIGWTPLWPHTNLRRRIASDRPLSSRVSDAALPSWSWLGWEGMTTWKYGESWNINPISSFDEETIPITEWYTSHMPRGGPRRRIRATWFEEREFHKNLNNPLPDGWTRHDISEVKLWREEPLIIPDGCGQSVFKYRDYPADENPYWYYPFPVAHIDAQTPFEVPEQTAYLFCKTKKASVWSERQDYGGFPDNGHRLKLRIEKGGKEIGTLHLQTDEQLELWPSVKGVEGDIEGKEVELVAIYRSVKYQKTFDKDSKRYGHPIVRKESYAVLWTVSEGDVAYRLACGEVERSAWEALDLTDIDLTLG